MNEYLRVDLNRPCTAAFTELPLITLRLNPSRIQHSERSAMAFLQRPVCKKYWNRKPNIEL
jgi:hypothetical protein